MGHPLRDFGSLSVSGKKAGTLITYILSPQFIGICQLGLYTSNSEDNGMLLYTSIKK